MMSTASTTSTRPESTSWVVDLPPDWLACADCGIATPAPPQGSPLLVTATTHARAGDYPGLTSPPPVDVTFTRCDACRARADLAGVLLDAHPRITHSIGSPSVAEHRLGSALVGLAAISRPEPDPATATDLDLRRLLAHLSGPGALARWSARYSPVLALDARLSTAAAHPFAHVTPEQRAALGTGWAACLNERQAAAAPAIDVPLALSRTSAMHEALTGCLLCGVASVRVSAVEVARARGVQAVARQVWSSAAVSLTSLGARRSPALLVGRICPACSRAVEHAESIGPTALLIALSEHLRPGHAITRHLAQSLDVPGLVGWAALAIEGWPPNATPWAHVSPASLARIERDLGTLVGGALLHHTRSS